MSYTITDVLSQILSAIQDILYFMSSAIAANAQVIATVIVVGGLAFVVWKYAGNIVRNVISMFRGLF